MLDKAIQFATQAHGDQTRKWSGLPYITHPIAVSELVRSVPHTDEMVIAAVLHDVVEDTVVTLDQVREEFGDTVAELVYYVTKITVPADGNRLVRKRMDADHYAIGSAESQTIKIADILDNTVDTHKQDPKFWDVYKHEVWYALDVLTKADPTLLKKAKAQVKARW